MSIQIKSLATLWLLLFFFTSSFAQQAVTVSGQVKEKTGSATIPFASVVLKSSKDSSFVSGTVSNEEGRFSLTNIQSGNYLLEISYIGYVTKKQTLYVGSLTQFLDLHIIELEEKTRSINEVTITAKQQEISEKLDKKTYSLSDNINQQGGSVLQAMQNLPGVTLQDGKVQLRGNEKVAVLVDGKQSAITGFGNQSGLDNIPASAIERIEIIANPSSKYDANGNAGIINIIYKKNKRNGFNGKVGLTTGLGSLWERKTNLPSIRPQYRLTPKINPSLSLNYRKNKNNLFFQGDYLYTQTLNKNEYVTRTYTNGDIIQQQTKRNRNTHFSTIKAGIDWTFNKHNSLTVSGLFGSEKIIDRGDQPFFNEDMSDRLRLWQFLEDELKTTVMGTLAYQHTFKEAGHLLNIGFNYTFHREDEKYFFDNILPSFTGQDAFKLISDEQVADLNIDYVRPLKYGKLEAGFKFRNRSIPTDMLFIPGTNSPLDTNAGGWATYKEIIPALYANYVLENKKWESEIGIRFEYVNLQYTVNPGHNTYKSDGYQYTQPFPNLRVAYKFDEHHKISFFASRRVDRPNEVDIRIFPKYDDAEIIKVGNPNLRPQFTNLIELGFKTNWKKWSFYTALYHRFANGTITRIASTVPGSNILYSIFQNAGRSYNSGIEMVLSQNVSKQYSSNINLNIYRNQINAFTVENKYPVTHIFAATQQELISGNIKWNNTVHFLSKIDAQISAVYLAPDIIPQGKIGSRFSVDLGIKKSIQKAKGEIFLNTNDLFNTMVNRKTVIGDGFRYTSTDYNETQVVRLGYTYKF